MGRGATSGPVIFVAAVFFAAAEVALARPHGELPDEPAKRAQEIQDPAVLDFSVPPELGYVVETHRPSATPPVVVVHIQEAHTNYDAQKHIRQILERLVQEHDLRLIFVEGGEGDVGLAYLRSYGPPENRREVAEKYLRLGVISAEEYLDIVSDYPLTLWGVEDKALYEQNVEVFLEAESVREAVTPILRPVHEALEVLRPKLLSPALIELEAKIKAFEREDLSLSGCAVYLSGLAKRHQLEAKQYPNLVRFLLARQLEGQINLDQIPEEQKALTTWLSRLIDAQELDGLIAKAKGLEAGTVEPVQFYAHLERLIEGTWLELEQYPNLSGYTRYLKHRSRIKATTLAHELTDLGSVLKRKLASTPEGQRLSEIGEELDLVEKLMGFRLSPDEYARLDRLNLGQLALNWKGFLTRQLQVQQFPSRPFARLDQLETTLMKLKRFYGIAHERDQAMVDNTIKKLRDSQQTLAVLITGGFHSPTITRLLKAQGLGVVVLAPSVGGATDERLYHAVLKYKNGNGSLEEVVRVAELAGIQAGGQPAVPAGVR